MRAPLAWFALGLFGFGGCFFAPPRPDASDVARARLAAGHYHACTLDARDELWCWGLNASTQLGVDTPRYSGVPVRAAEGTWTSIAAGFAHSCGVRDGRAYCWGANAAREAAPASTEPEVELTEVALPSVAPIARVYAGGSATCAIDDVGDLYCWGRVEPGDSVMPKRFTPGGLGGPWQSVAIAADHACALAVTGSVACWGNNGELQLGTSDVTAVVVSDQAFVLEPTFTTIAAGPGSSCGILRGDGALYCWGASVITQNDVATPGRVVDPRAWDGVEIGDDFACAVRDGEVYCYGTDTNGAIGRGTLDTRTSDRTFGMPAIGGANEVAAGNGFACARTSGGETSCWGSNRYGELGNGEIATQRQPVAIPLTGVTALALAENHTCALTGQTTYCWGRNYDGQVTKTPGPPVTMPVAVEGRYVALATGYKHTCGTSADRSQIECWGVDEPQRQLDSSGVALASSLGASNTWLVVAAKHDTTCGMTDAGWINCWGDLGGTSSSGGFTHVALGDEFGIRVYPGTAYDEWGTECSVGTHPFDPAAQARVTGLEITAIAAGDGHVCSIESGDIYCWGRAESGQGGPPVQACVTPRMVSHPTDVDWAKLAAAGQHTCAIDVQQNLYCWGENSGHSLTDDLEAVNLVPQIVTTLKWSLIAGGQGHTCGVTTQGQLYCWGLNHFGEVGNGLSYQGTPVEVQLP